MRPGLLRGRDHHTLGWVDVIGEASAAAALCLGGAPKRYAHADPNEDAAGYGVGAASTLLCVCDAHDGFEASEVLVEHVLANPGAHWCDEAFGTQADQWPRHVIAALCDANEDALREARDRGGVESTSTLTLALVQPALGQLAYASIGDSLLFVVDADGVREIARPSETPGRTAFLGGAATSPETLTRLTRAGVIPLDGVEAVVVATDGLSERGIGAADPAAAVARAAALAREASAPMRAMTFARTVAEEAIAAQRSNSAGDNIGIATWWSDAAPSA